METSGLTTAFKRYAEELAALERAGQAPEEAQVLRVLLARDALQSNLDPNRQDLSHTGLQIINLDSRLKKLSSLIASSVDLKEWNTSIKPPPESWWWTFEAAGDRLSRLNWLWGGLTAISMTFAISFAVDISSRFIKGAPDTAGTFALVTQGLIMALSTGGVATKFGRDAIDKALNNFKVPARFWNVMKAGMATVLFLAITAFHLSMPLIAVLYNNQALELQNKGRTTSALSYYKRALALYPDYPAAHYNQGLLYEDLQDYKTALTEYRLAVQGGLDAAYNNLARLNIINQNHKDAVTLLINGLTLVKDDRVKYDMLKNLGWARVSQSRFSEAEVNLRTAIDLDNSRAPAYCLLAQALDGEGDNQAALTAWNDCIKLANAGNPDEDQWIGMARQRLTSGGGTR
jgi:tetratricopeptide (TPR) repeat protein